METIVNSIISSFLADYLEINPEKTKLSILTGTVDLYGVKFKKTLFTTLNIPYLELVDGYIGKIHVDLSLPRFYLYPINVLVDKIYVKVKPKDMNKIKEEDIIKTFEIFKRKRLQQLEELMNIKFSALFDSQDDKNKKKDKKEGLTMVENIINNLHIKIQNVVSIYDDCISSPKYPVTLGVTLDRIFIDSTSKDFKYQDLSEEEKLSPFKYKKLSIENLNVFLDNIKQEDIIIKDDEKNIILKIREETKNNLDVNDKVYLGDSVDFYLYCESEIQFYSKDSNYHSYLLRDLHPEIRLTINENFYDENNKEPQMKGTIDIKTISLEVSNKQIETLTNTINYITLKDFYQQTTIDNYFNKVEKLDNDLIRNYLEEYSQYYKTKYIEIYKNEKENKKFMTNMENIEKNLKIDTIIALREMGKDTINSMIEIGKLDKKIESSEGGFFSFFWSKSNDEIDKLKLEKEKKIKEQKELQLKNSTLNQFKNYVSGMLENNESNKEKEDKEEFVFNFIMEKLNLIIKEQKKEEGIKKIFEINFIKFESQIIVKTISQFIKLTLKDMKFSQFLSENKNYETILYSENINVEKKDEEVSLILIEFEHNLKFEISPFKFKLNFGKQMFIIIDYYYLYYLYNMFLKHISALDFDNLTSLVNDKITSIVKVGYNNLIKNRNLEEEKEKEQNNDKLFNINIDISLTAPILLFPLYFRDINNKQMLYISLGILKIYSKLADANNQNEIYDKYIVEFSNFVMKTIDIYNSQEIIKDNVGEKIFYKSSFNVELKNYIYKSQKKSHKTLDFSPLIIDINLNDIKICLCEEQIVFLINYLENFLRTQNEFTREQYKEIENKNKLKEDVQVNKDDNKKELEQKEEKKKEITLDIKEEKEENKQQINQEISNTLKLSIKFGSVQLFLIRNLNENKKINFLSFFFKESYLNLLTKSNNSMNMDISFGHFFLYDEDLKIDESTKKEVPAINPEFRYIAGTTFFDFKTPKEKRIKFSEIYNYKKDEKNNTNNETPGKESIKIIININAITNKTDVDIVMCKLTLSPNFSTISRAYQFLFKYLDIYNQSLHRLKSEQLKEQIINNNQNIFEGISPAPIATISNKEKNSNESIILKSRDKSIINLSFTMEGINILLPIEHESSNTFIIYMEIEMPITYVMEADAESLFKDSLLYKVHYFMKKTELTIDIKNGSFSIYEYKNDFILLNNKNKLINDFGMTLFLKNNLDNKEKASKNNIQIFLDKDSEISININQIIIFMNLFSKFNEFLSSISKEDNNKKPIKEKEDFLDDEDYKLAVKKSIINEIEKKEATKKLKRKETKQIQDINYIDIYTYDIVFSNFYIKFYDIIDGVYQSLIEFSMKDTSIEFLQNSNPQDSTNLIKFLKSIFSPESQNKKNLVNYDKNNLYMYFEVSTNIEVKTLNNYLNQWEYFVEPFKLKFNLYQLLKRMRQNIELFIENMININVSLNFAKILKFTIQKFNMEQEEIKKEKEKEETNYNIDTNIDNIDTPRYIGYEAPVLILENYTGVDMEIWFDNIKYEENNKDLIIKIKRNEKYELTMNLLEKYNVKNVEKKKNNLNSTMSYKFIIDQSLIKDMNIKEKNLVGNNFNINYHHIDIHNISNQVKVSIESLSDHLLIRHIIFSSLVSIKNESIYQDLEIYNNIEQLPLKNKRKQNIPISWLLEIRNPNLLLLHEDKMEILIKNMNDIDNMYRYVKFKNGHIIMVDKIKYKINLDEYYLNHNISHKKEDIYRTDIIITSPINLINNTPYDFIIKSNEKINPLKSLSSSLNNSDLLIEYYQKMSEQGNKYSNNKKNEIIMKIVKDIKLEMLYNNKSISAVNYINEKDEEKKEGNNATYNKSILILLKNDNSHEYLICRLILYNPYNSLHFDNKSYKEMKIELNSFRYEIIFDYYFVNKTSNNLFFNNAIDLFKSSKENILISAKQFLPVAKILLKDKIKFRKNDTDWTEDFEISAIGKEFILNIKNDKKGYNALSIISKISTKFNKSIYFIIEEKFVVINELPFDINIKEDKSNIINIYKSKESNVLLLDKDTINKKNCFRVGINNCFSHLFDLTKLGSYDLLIPYDQKTFEKYKIDTQNNLIEYDSKKYFPIRCIINTLYNNTIYIIFTLNNKYINQLKNHTPQTIEVFIHDNKTKKFIVKPEKSIPLIYINKEDKYEPFENIKIVFNKNDKTNVNINEITSKFCGVKKDYFIKISPKKNNSVKSITLFGKEDKRLLESFSIKKRIKNYTISQGAKILLNLEGIGFSLIDETPKEIFYLSFYKIFLNYNYYRYNNILNEMNLYDSLTFSLKNIQLDYCLDNAYEIIFNPTNQILPKRYGEKVKKEKNFLDKISETGDDDTPFIQFVMSKKSKQQGDDNNIKIIYTIFPEIGIIIQEFDARINTILINCFINLTNQYLKIFLPEEENNNEIEINVDKINKEKNSLIEDDNLNINEIKDKLLKKGEETNPLIINILTLSAIKANTTFKVNKNAIEIKFLPEILVTILNTFCSTLTSFSDVTIKLNEFTFMNIFSDFDSLYSKLYSFYKNELLVQIYKIIFNMDLIGNPLNLVEGMGTGIFEFFNEPRKGLLKGPEEFGIGIAKGTKSLVTNIVGGGFKSASKITGTLLNASKNLSSLGTKQEEVVTKEEEKPRGLFSGALSGLKKGFGEIKSGVTGIVTKPIEESKKGGVGGFFKGLGSGVLGAVLTPVNTVLTVGNEVTSGISNSEFISNKKTLRRFRLPRTLYKYVPISPYNEKLEIERKNKRKEVEGTDRIIISLSNESLCLENSTEIIMYSQLKDNSILLFSDVMIKILDKDGKKFLKKIYVCNIKDFSEKDNNVELIKKNSEHEIISFASKKDKNNFINEIKKYLN